MGRRWLAAAVLLAACGSGDESVDLSGIDVPAHDSLDPAELRDLATMAEQEGISLDESIVRFSWGDDFSLVVSGIAPGAVADAAIDGPTTAFVEFVGEPPIDALEALAELERQVPWITIEIRSGAEISAALANEMLVTAYSTIFERDDVADATGEVDMAERAIRITIASPADGASQASTDELQAVAEQAVGARFGTDVASRLTIVVTRSPLTSLGGDDG